MRFSAIKKKWGDCNTGDFHHTSAHIISQRSRPMFESHRASCYLEYCSCAMDEQLCTVAACTGYCAAVLCCTTVVVCSAYANPVISAPFTLRTREYSFSSAPCTLGLARIQSFQRLVLDDSRALSNTGSHASSLYPGNSRELSHFSFWYRRGSRGLSHISFWYPEDSYSYKVLLAAVARVPRTSSAVVAV